MFSLEIVYEATAPTAPDLYQSFDFCGQEELSLYPSTGRPGAELDQSLKSLASSSSSKPKVIYTRVDLFLLDFFCQFSAGDQLRIRLDAGGFMGWMPGENGALDAGRFK